MNTFRDTMEVPSDSFTGRFLFAVMDNSKRPFRVDLRPAYRLVTTATRKGLLLCTRSIKMGVHIMYKPVSAFYWLKTVPSMKIAEWHEKIYAPRPSMDVELWKRIKEAVLERDWYRCQACGNRREKKKLTVHHIIPRAEDGQDDLDNLIALCYSCHDQIEEMSLRSAQEIRGCFKPEKIKEPEEEPEEVISEEWRPSWHKFVYGGCKRK